MYSSGKPLKNDEKAKKNEKLVESLKQSARPVSSQAMVDETPLKEEDPKSKSEAEDPPNVFTFLPFPSGEQPNGEETEESAPQSYLDWSADRDERTPGDALPVAPPLSFGKFLTMQEKRVPVTVCYTEDSDLRPLYLTAAKRIKDAFPDVLVEKRILPKDGNQRPLFEILVDGKVIVGGRRDKKMHMHDAGRSVIFVSMRELDGAVNKARRKRRPSTLYSTNNGEDGDAANDVTLKLQMARKNRKMHQKKD